MEERVVRFRPRAILIVIGMVLGTVLAILFLRQVSGVLVWILIAVFLATALNPAVEFLLRRGIKRRGAAVGIVFAVTLLAIVAICATFVPTLVREINDFADAVPGYVQDLTKGEGRLGFLERDYHIVERVRQAIEKSGVAGVLGLSSTALTVTKSIVNTIVALVTISFLTLFMLLEGSELDPAALLAAARGASAALAQGRVRHLPHDRRLRRGEPRDQPDRRAR